jgi:tetratricopeptide (TPR) repeat protein
MALLWKTLFLTLLAASLFFLAWILYYPKPAPRSQEEALSRMIALERDGRYDEAVKTVRGWLQDSRRDVSRDGLLYEQMAAVYIGKAYKNPNSREDSVRQARLNFEEALTLRDQQHADDLGLDFFEIGGGYELIGDLPVTEKCECYEKAQQLFERQLPLIQADTYTAFGKTYSLNPLRADVNKHLTAVRQKLSNAGCPANVKP